PHAGSKPTIETPAAAPAEPEQPAAEIPTATPPPPPPPPPPAPKPAQEPEIKPVTSERPAARLTEEKPAVKPAAPAKQPTIERPKFQIPPTPPSNAMENLVAKLEQQVSKAATKLIAQVDQ